MLLPPHSLQHNYLDDHTKQQLTDANRKRATPAVLEFCEWRKRKPRREPNCKVFQAKLAPPSVKRFVPKPRPGVPEHIVCRCGEEGNALAPLEEDSMVCHLNALLGKDGKEVVEAVAEAPETPKDWEQSPKTQAPERAPRPPTSHANVARPRAVAMRRGGQRWSTLVSAPTSRIARVMRPVLGDALWHSFVAHANAHYKEAFVGAFAGPVLACVGRDGAMCPPKPDDWASRGISGGALDEI